MAMVVATDTGADRTAELRKMGYTGRNLRKLQMTTDTAVRVTRMVVEGKRKSPAGHANLPQRPH